MTLAASALDQLTEAYSRILEDVSTAARASGRRPADVTVVAVTKTFSRDYVDAAYALGIRDFGENRVQEARDKFGEPLPEDAHLALIGNLQSNKIRQALGLFSSVHTVDRSSLVAALAKEAERLGIQLPIQIQVNIGLEPQKSGCPPKETGALLDAIRTRQSLRCAGLFAIAPMVADPEQVRPYFRALRQLRDTLATEDISLPELSMGMSGDYAVAIAEGATQVRIGSALFGRR